jgi:hypothetical protein
MTDKFIRWPKPYLLLSTTCDEIASWMVEIWMKKHSVSGSKSMTPPPKKNLQGMTNNVGIACSLGNTILWFTISIEQDN